MSLEQMINLPDTDIELPDSILKKIKTIPDMGDAKVSWNNEASVSLPYIPEPNIVAEPSDIELSARHENEHSKKQPSQITVISSINHYRDAHEIVVRVIPIIKKLTSLMEDEPQLEGIEKAAKTYRSSESRRILQEMPIESLNHNKRGIRISALRSAGYLNVQQIRHLSYQNLMQIRGIGEQSARLIQVELRILEQRAAQQVTMQPMSKQTREGVSLVTEYYKYRKLCELKATVTSGFFAIYGEVKTNYAVAKNARNRFTWLFTFGTTKKKRVLDAAIQINNMLSEKIAIEVQQHFNTRQSILSTPDDNAWRDYAKRQCDYDSAFRSM